MSVLQIRGLLVILSVPLIQLTGSVVGLFPSSLMGMILPLEPLTGLTVLGSFVQGVVFPLPVP